MSIWNEIKDLPIEMFALPNQKVFNHVDLVSETENKAVCRFKSATVIPALEAVLNSLKVFKKEKNTHVPKYKMEESENYLIISFFEPIKEEKVTPEMFISGTAPKKSKTKVSRSKK